MPHRYPGIADQLRRARPDELIVDNVDAWPQENEQAEDQLRNRLRDFAVLTPDGARKEVALLEKDHGWRRGTVWADLDQAPLAFALEQLVTLAEVTATPLGDAGLASLVDDYTGRGWRADDAVVRALASVRSAGDRGAVSAACAALYRQWLDDGARALQKAIGPMANDRTYVPGPPASTTPGVITVFVDGLRLDVARRLEDRLAGAGFDVATTTSLAALPTVTETAKAALVPAPTDSLGPGPDLHPANVVTGTKASIQVLRGLMAENGVQVVGTTETGSPGRDCVDRNRRDRPPRPRRRRAARRVPRRRGGPHRRPHPRAARRGMDTGRRRHRPRLDAAPGRHGEGGASGGDDRAQEGAMRPAQGRRRSRRRRPSPGSGIQMYASRSPRGRPVSRQTRSTSTAE